MRPNNFGNMKSPYSGFSTSIIRRRAENIGAVERRHRLLLLRADDEHGVVKSAHDPLRAEQHGKSAGSAGRFGMHGRNAMQVSGRSPE